MAASAPVSKQQLIDEARTQWRTSEAAVQKCAGANFDTPAADCWSAGDAFRHIIDTAHRTPEMLEALVREGALPAGDYDAVRAAGIQSFKTLNSRMLPIEMNTAHGIVWMALQKLSDEDLQKEVDVMGNKLALGAFIQNLTVAHEQNHVEQAMRAAGVSS